MTSPSVPPPAYDQAINPAFNPSYNQETLPYPTQPVIGPAGAPGPIMGAPGPMMGAPGPMMGASSPMMGPGGQDMGGPPGAASTLAATKKNLLQRAISLPSPEEKEEMAFRYSEQSIRSGFIRKVYSLLMCQLAITSGFIAMFIFHPDLQMTWVVNNLWLFWTCFVLTLVTLIPMVCIKPLRTNFPLNIIILFAFTVCESITVAMVSALYDVEAVLIAFGLTCAITFLLTIFAIQTKIDFTCGRAALLCLLFMLMVFGFIMIFWFSGSGDNLVLQMIFGSCGALVFSLYLIYDTQMMLGGDHKYSISPEEYVFATLALYLDVINIFLYILKIVGAAKKS